MEMSEEQMVRGKKGRGFKVLGPFILEAVNLAYVCVWLLVWLITLPFWFLYGINKYLLEKN
jgi:hypothetical protein